MFLILLLQAIGLGCGTRQRGELLGTIPGDRGDCDRVLADAWRTNRRDLEEVPGVELAEGVQASELITALKNQHLIELRRQASEPPPAFDLEPPAEQSADENSEADDSADVDPDDATDIHEPADETPAEPDAEPEPPPADGQPQRRRRR